MPGLVSQAAGWVSHPCVIPALCETLIPSFVRALALGSRISLPAGATHSLKEVRDTWQLFVAL